MPASRRFPQRDEKADLTPMIDVTFLLLIFFLVTMKFRTLEGRHDAALPKDLGTGVHPVEPVETATIEVRVTQPGQLSYRAGTRKFGSLGALRAYLDTIPLDTPVTIDMREETVHQDFMSVIDQCADRGFERIMIAGTHEN
jgi:biopolymer transport protein ExbD